MHFAYRVRRSPKRVIATVVFLLIALVFAGISSFSGAEKQAHKVVRVAVASSPTTLDPKMATGATSVRVLRLLAQGLVLLDEGLQPQPALADVFSHKNFQEYRFSWGQKVFTNGVRITPEFVKSYFESIINPETGSPLRGSFADVASIEVEGDELVIKLSKPNPWFWQTLELPIALYEDGHVYGSGDFLLVDRDLQGGLTLQRRSDAQLFHLMVAKDPMVRVLKLMNGEVDIVHNDLPDELVAYAEEQAGVSVVSAPSASYTYMGFLMDEGVTADVRIRKAISYGIDRSEIIEKLLGGRAQPALSLLQEEHPAYLPSAEQGRDVALAKSLLADAGYNETDNRLTLQLAITTNPFILRLAQVLQAQLAEVGVDVAISSAEWGTFYGNIKKGNFQSYILTWVGNFTPDIYRMVFDSSKMPPNGANRGRYASVKMDALIRDMVVELDDEKRISLARQVQALQNEDMIYVPLWKRDHVALVRSGVQGYRLTKDGDFSSFKNVMVHK